MPFDGIVTAAVAQELRACLVGGKIEKIYHPEPEELILHIQKGREKYRLLLSAGSSHARIHLIDDNGSNPQNPTGFCMLLRKHFQGGRIAEIHQIGSERIVEILVDSVNELGVSVNRGLTIEIMGKHSNIIAKDLSTGKILDSIKRVSLDVNRYRQILPGLPYVAPPSQDKRSLFDIEEAQFFALFPGGAISGDSLVKGIQGFSPAFAEAFADDLIGTYNVTALWRHFLELRNKILTNAFSPAVYENEEDDPIDFHVFPLTGYKDPLPFSSPSAAANHFFGHKESSNRVRQKSKDLARSLESILQKQQSKKQKLSEELLQAQNAEPYRLYGELLTASLHLINSGAEKAIVPNYYDNSTIEIPLDPRFSPAKNAQRYFKKYAKAKTAVHEKQTQLSETCELLDYLASVLVFVENAASIEEIEEIRHELVEGGYLRKRKSNNYRPSKSKLQPYAYTTSDGFRLLVGRNNKENDMLTLKTADKKDIWFHTKDIPGSHVILITEGRPVTETAIFEAAAIAAYYCKSRSSENIPVDYVSVRHVKKPAGAKPGMVIFTNNKTVYVNPFSPNKAE